MSKIAAVMTRAKVTVTDLVGLTGISRPTLTKIIKGEGSTWQMKQDALMETAKKVAVAVRHKKLPMERIRSESQDQRLVRLQAALDVAAKLEKERARAAREAADETPAESSDD
mgnify:FL=1